MTFYIAPLYQMSSYCFYYILHPKGQNILVGQITRAGGEFLRAAGEIPHNFIY